MGSEFDSVIIFKVYYLLEKWFPLKNERGHSLYFFIQPSPPFIFLVVFYLLDQRTISGVDILEMTWKDGVFVLCPYYGHLPGL